MYFPNLLVIEAVLHRYQVWHRQYLIPAYVMENFSIFDILLSVFSLPATPISVSATNMYSCIRPSVISQSNLTDYVLFPFIFFDSFSFCETFFILTFVC